MLSIFIYHYIIYWISVTQTCPSAWLIQSWQHVVTNWDLITQTSFWCGLCVWPPFADVWQHVSIDWTNNNRIPRLDSLLHQIWAAVLLSSQLIMSRGPRFIVQPFPKNGNSLENFKTFMTAWFLSVRWTSKVTSWLSVGYFPHRTFRELETISEWQAGWLISVCWLLFKKS